MQEVRYTRSTVEACESRWREGVYIYGETHSPSVEKGAHNAKLLNDHRYDRTAIRSGLSSNRARRSYFHSDITVTKRLIR